jgi:hypothetical protein
MSYSEKDNQVILTMSREDYQLVLMMIRSCHGWKNAGDLLDRLNAGDLLARLNSGNPHYTPYQVEK